MNLQTAKSLLPALKAMEGDKSIDGYVVKKFLITPRGDEKTKEFLSLYQLNKWDEHGIIVDCYRSEDLTIIVQYDMPYPNIKYQSLQDFLLKRKL